MCIIQVVEDKGSTKRLVSTHEPPGRSLHTYQCMQFIYSPQPVPLRLDTIHTTHKEMCERTPLKRTLLLYPEGSSPELADSLHLYLSLNGSLLFPELCQNDLL